MIEKIKQTQENIEAWIQKKKENKITWFKLHPVIREQIMIKEKSLRKRLYLLDDYINNLSGKKDR